MTEVWPSRRRRILVAMSPLSLALLPPVFFALIATLAGRGRAEAFYNSDLLHPYMLLEDLARGFDAVRSWYHSPALSIFPDWLIAAFVMTLPVPPLWWPLFYAPTLMTLYCVAGGALIAAGGAARLVPGTWMVAAMLFIGGLVTAAYPAAPLHPWPSAPDVFAHPWLYSPSAPVGPWIYLHGAAPYIHTGATLAAIAASALLLVTLTRGGVWGIAALAGVVFVAGFSDLLFTVWFAGPACVVAVMHAYARGGRRSLAVALMIAAAAAAAIALDFAIHGVLRQHAENLVPYRESFAAAAAAFRRIAASGDVLLFAVLALSLVAIARAATIFLRAMRRRDLPATALLDLLLGGIAAAALLAPLATGFFVGIGLTRYFMVLGLVAALTAAMLVLRLLGAARQGRAALAAGGAVAVAGVALAGPAAGALPRIVAPPPLAACLAREARTVGIGDYWTAKHLMFASGRRIHIVPITDHGLLYRWNTNGRWFTQRADTGKAARPDFVVPARLERYDFRESFGPPQRIVTCAGAALWLYDAPLALPP